MKEALKKLRTLAGRVWRDVERQAAELSGQSLEQATEVLSRVRRVLDQRRQGKNRIYRLHVPEAECISKGKARQTCEFGVKVTVATTHREGLVVGMRALPGNPCDGHTLDEALERIGIPNEVRPHTVFVDRGYRGAEPPGVRVCISGQRRGITRKLKAELKRRSAIGR
jgi:IS5 family transposase